MDALCHPRPTQFQILKNKWDRKATFGGLMWGLPTKQEMGERESYTSEFALLLLAIIYYINESIDINLSIIVTDNSQ